MSQREVAGRREGCGFALDSGRNDSALTPGMCLAESGDILCLCSAKDPQISRPGIHLIKMTFLCKLSWRLGRSVHMRPDRGTFLGPGLGSVQL